MSFFIGFSDELVKLSEDFFGGSMRKALKATGQPAPPPEPPRKPSPEAQAGKALRAAPKRYGQMMKALKGKGI